MQAIRGLEQAEVVAGEVEDSGREVMSARAHGSTLTRRSTGSSITLRYASTGAWGGVAHRTNAVDRDVDPARPAGSPCRGRISSRRLWVSPCAEGAAAEDREGAVAGGPVRRSSSGGCAGLVGGVADAEHPLVAADGAHAAADGWPASGRPGRGTRRRGHYRLRRWGRRVAGRRESAIASSKRRLSKWLYASKGMWALRETRGARGRWKRWMA